MKHLLILALILPLVGCASWSRSNDNIFFSQSEQKFLGRFLVESTEPVKPVPKPEQ